MRKLLQLSLILGVIFSLFAIHPSTPARAEAPISTGTWTGYFTRDVKITNNLSGVLIEASGSGKGDLTFNVSNDGSVTGKIENYHGEFEWGSSLAPGGSCKFSGSWDVTGGTVTLNTAGRPVFDLQLKATARTMDCDPVLPGGSDTNPTNSAHFEASTYSGGKITGDLFRFENDMVDKLIKDMATVGAEMTVQEYWELKSSSSVAAIQAPEPIYFEYFLAGVEFMNTYWTSVDWHDTPPGTVEFTLEGLTMEAVLDDFDRPSATFELGKLPPGKTPLVASAIGTDGQVKDSKSTDVTMVPMEKWAQDAGFDVADTKPYDLWKQVIYRGKTYVPKEPITLPYLDLSSIPVIGGKWGMEKPFQVVVNLEATSKGGLSDPAKITGEANLFLGDNDHPLKMTVDGQTVTNMTESALLFDHGNANFKTTPLSFVRNVGLVDLIPPAQALYKIPVFGQIIEYLNSNGLGIELSVTAKAKGQGDLGVATDQSRLIFTKGYVTPSITFSAKAGIFPDPIKIAVGGGGTGTFQIQIAPTTGLQDCSFYLKFYAQAFGLPFESPDYGIYACQKAMSGGHRVLAAYLPPSLVNQQPAASFQDVAQKFVLNSRSEQSPNSTILVSGAAPEASLNLASSPDGRMAFVSTNGKQGQVGLRLFDGQAWGEPVLLGDASRINMNPIADFDASGQVVIAWVMPAAGTLPPLDKFDPFFSSWEVAYAVIDKSGKVITQKNLTQDDQPDFYPQLARSSDGTLWLAWLKSPSHDMWGAKDNPNWLQAASWDGKSWSSAEMVSKEVVGTVGLRMAASGGKDVSIVTNQDSDGDPKTITDNEIYLYQHSGAAWTTQRLTNDQEADVFPVVAYTPQGQLVLAWKRGDALVGLEGDLKATPAVWNVGSPDQPPDLLGAELLAGSDGELAFLWPSFTANGQGVWLAQRPSSSTDWQSAAPLVDGLEGAGMLSAQLTQNGSLWVGLSQLHVPAESQDVPGLGQVSVSGLPTSTDLAVIEAAGAMHPVSAANANHDKPGVLGLQNSKIPPVILLGLGAILALVILVFLATLMVRRSRSKNT